jgi:hypothetical protein
MNGKLKRLEDGMLQFPLPCVLTVDASDAGK